MIPKVEKAPHKNWSIIYGWMSTRYPLPWYIIKFTSKSIMSKRWLCH